MSKWLWIAVVAVAIAALVSFGLRQLVRASHERPTDLGWRDPGFRPCPDMPNCVNSLSDDPRHAIAPLTWSGDLPKAMDRMLRLIEAMPRTTIVSNTEDYLHAEFRTGGFDYVDDVEMFFDSQSGLIHVHSSARVPYYDFRVNRERVESIRAAWQTGR